MDKLLKAYIESINGISQTTFDPKGPGVVRIHLVPPAKIKMGIPWLVIINGQDILPLSLGWSILLREFIEEVNKRRMPIVEEEISIIIDSTIIRMKKIFPKTSEKILKEDLRDIIDTFTRIASGKKPRFDIGYMDLKQYAKRMRAPHRMDLMISSMVKNNHWHCNNQCLHCYASNQPMAECEELKTSEWKLIIDKLKEACVPQITFTGGEPTLREDLVELVKYAEWHVTRLNTNGRRLSLGLCKDLYEANLDSVQITVYDKDPAIHNLLVGSQGFLETLEGVKNATEAGLNVSINTPLCKLNKDYVSLVKFFHEECQVKYFTCSSLILTGNAENSYKDTMLEQEELIQIIQEAYKYAEKNDCEIMFTTPGALPKEVLMSMNMNIPMCGAASSNMAVAPNGDVVPCQSWLSEGSLGNLLTDNWKQIWNSKECKSKRCKNVKESTCPLSKKGVK